MVCEAPVGSVSSMEVNVDVLEQMDLMDVSDHEALDVFLSEGAVAPPPGAAVLLHCLGAIKPQLTSPVTMNSTLCVDRRRGGPRGACGGGTAGRRPPWLHVVGFQRRGSRDARGPVGR